MMIMMIMIIIIMIPIVVTLVGIVIDFSAVQSLKAEAADERIGVSV